MNRIELKEIILDQQKRGIKEDFIERDIFKIVETDVKNPFIIIISGMRRVGKSTLLQQIRYKYPGYFLNLDDERLVNFKLEDFHTVYELFLELFGKKDFFYFDEIQNITGWERFARRLHDEGKKIFVTGSNASLLSRELGTHLTGRYLEINLYPFSFNEFLRFKGLGAVSKEGYSTETKVIFKKYFEEYLLQGGLPEYLKTGNKEYLNLLYDNILYRDIIVRYKLPHEKILKELVHFIASNLSREISFNSIKTTLQLGSSTTVKEYFNYLENSFLVFLLQKFDYSSKKQIYLGKKAYLIDTGLAANLGFRLSNDLGRLLENLVFLELKRKKKEIYYYHGKRECDFVIKEGIKVTEAVQVCYELHRENKEREIEGLREALDKFRLSRGVILTLEQEEELSVGGKQIMVLPVWKWLLG